MQITNYICMSIRCMCVIWTCTTIFLTHPHFWDTDLRLKVVVPISHPQKNGGENCTPRILGVWADRAIAPM